MAVDNLVVSAVNSLQNSLLSVWYSFLDAVPGLLIALILVLIGYIVAVILEHIALHVFRVGLIDKWIEDRNLQGAIGKVKLSVVFAALIKWYIFVLFVAQALVSINVYVLARFATVLVDYIPLAIGSVVLVIGGLLIGRYISNKVLKTEHKYKKSVATVVELAIAYVTVVA